MESPIHPRIRTAVLTLSRLCGIGAIAAAVASAAPASFGIALAGAALLLPAGRKMLGLAAAALALFTPMPAAGAVALVAVALVFPGRTVGVAAGLAAAAVALLLQDTALVFLAAGVLATFPTIVVAEGAGGSLARRLLPLALALGVGLAAAGQPPWVSLTSLGVAALAIVLAAHAVQRTERDRSTFLAELERSRHFLEQAQDVATMGCWVSDLDEEGALWWSPQTLEIFGLRRDEFDGSVDTFFRRVHPGDRQAIREAVRQAIENRRPYSIDHRIIRPDGSIRWVYERAVVVEGRMVGVVQDITERKRIEELLRHARVELEEGIERRTAELRGLERERTAMLARLVNAEKLQAVGRLAAGIAHEINTPLQFIGDNAQFLKEAFDEMEVRDAYFADQVPRAIEQTLEGIERVTKIVRALNEFAHPAAEEMAEVDLNHLVERAITVTRNEWKYVADVEADLDPRLPTIRCYQGDLNQVLVNILVNAAQAIAVVVPEGSDTKGRIRVATRKVGPWVEIRIADTGPGIPPEHRRKIFEPFFTTKDIGQGTGQGLAISRSVIVDKHGGSLDFESEVGKGTTFYIRLPIEGPVR